MSKISAVFGLLLLITAGKLFIDKDAATACFCLVIAVLALIPIAISLRDWSRREYTRDIAGVLENTPDDVLSFDKLAKLIPIQHPISKLQMLIKLGYLQRIVIDSASQTVTLNAPYRQGKNIHMDVICPYCGTKSNVLCGSVEKCKNCNRFLSTAIVFDEDGNAKYV